VIIRDILSVLRRRWWVVVACVILGGIAGIAGAVLAKPVYTSTARILVATPHVDQGALIPPGGLTPQQRAANYATLATGPAIAAKVIDQLHLTEPMTVLQQSTSVSVLSGTTIIQVSSSAADATQAQQIAHAFAQNLITASTAVTSESGEASGIATLTLTDDAQIPPLPVTSSKASTVALGIIGGLVLGLLLTWLVEYLDTRVHDSRKLAQLVRGPILGGVRDDPTPSADRLLTSSENHGAYAESYRTLRTALQFLDVDTAAPVFAVIGATSGTGTSTCAANIAASMAQAGQRTLLIDADLHHPGQGALLGLGGDGRGLADVLAGTAALTDAVVRWEAGGVDVLPAGSLPALPTELVQSRAMDELLTKARGQYDIVIVDTPALAGVPDGALLAAAADGAILVTRSGFTRSDDLASAEGLLATVRARALGSVLLNAPRNARTTGRAAAPQPSI
jgi:receptor protein-tyrosine kinase